LRDDNEDEDDDDYEIKSGARHLEINYTSNKSKRGSTTDRKS